MAMIRMPNASDDDRPTFYNPGTSPSPSPPPTSWNLYAASPTSAMPVPTSAPSAPPATTWPAASGPSFDDLLKTYWDPDRRQRLVKELQTNYHAPDKQSRIDYYTAMSDADLWAGNPNAPSPTPAPQTPIWQQAPGSAAPPGFEAGKWSNTNWTTDKYKAGRILAAGGSIPDVIAALGNGWRQISQDAIMAPDGSVFDLYFDYGGPNQRVQWTQVGGGPGSGMPAPPRPPGMSYPTTSAAAASAATSTAPNLSASPTAAPTATAANPLVTPQSAPIPRISWQPGTQQAWQRDPTSQAAFAQVADALARALGRAPTPEEVWAQLNYAQRPDRQFMQHIVSNIQANVKPDVPAPQQAQAAANDPYLDEYQRYLDEYLKTLASQRSRWESDNETFRQRQAQAQQSTERLIKFLEERSQRLMQPAYTGAEGEVFRTKALEPIESDRGAAKQRAMQRISERGIDPSSGIAQELLNQVDTAFDKSRATTQNELAYNQITEQRSREQEAQQLLGMIPSIQDAAMRGDVDFLNLLDQQIRNTYSEGMGPTQLKYQIPTDALQQALAALGLGTNPNQLLQMLMSQQQYNQGNSNALWGSLGSMLPYILNLFGSGGGNPYSETHGPPR